MKIWLLEKKNANDIYNHIKNEGENIFISKQKIEEILTKLLNFIAHYLKGVYILENISKKNEFKNYAIDESEFVKINGVPLWVIGIINTADKIIRLEVSYNRDEGVIKKIINTHIKTGNNII